MMELYKSLTINELCLKVTDGAHFSPSEEEMGTYPMYSSKDMLYNGFDDKDVKMISKTDYDRLVKQDCRPLTDDVLIIKDGNNYLKQIFKVKSTLDAVILSSIAILRPNKEIVNPDYFTYVLRTESVRKSMANYVSGAAIPRVVLKDFKKMKLRLHKDIHIQFRIASILYAYDNLIENNNRRIRLLEQMAENLYKEWFAFHRIKDSSNEIRLTDIITIHRGLSYSSEEIECEEGNDLINLKNIQAFGGFRLDGTKKYDGKFKQDQVVIEGDLIMGVTDMTQDRRTVGSVALIPNIKALSVITADLIKLVSPVDNVYLYAMFRWGNVSKYISQFANGANVLHLRPQILKNIKVLLPQQDLMDKYVSVVKPMIETTNKLNTENEHLSRQRDLLLPRLMSGKLEVKSVSL